MNIKFKDFINEKYILTIEDSMDDFDVTDYKWELEYDVKNVWEDYKKNKNNNNFLKNYKDILLSKKNELLNLGKECWNDLVKLINEKNNNIYPYLDKIYDWADKYGIKITSK